jgi:hypothetical protein
MPVNEAKAGYMRHERTRAQARHFRTARYTRP